MTVNTGGAVRYTVFHSNSGDVYGRGLTVQAAAKALLDYEDPTCAVIADQDIHGGWHLLNSETWPSNGPSIAYFVQAETEEMAWELFAKMVVVSNGYGLKAMTDERYAEYKRKALGQTAA